MSLPKATFDDVIQNDALDHITRNILSNCDGETIESCRIVSPQFNRVVMDCKKSLDKLIKRIRYKRFLVHPIIKGIIENIEAEGNYAQKKKLARLLINFDYCQSFAYRGTMGFDIISMTNFFLGKIFHTAPNLLSSSFKDYVQMEGLET